MVPMFFYGQLYFHYSGCVFHSRPAEAAAEAMQMASCVSKNECISQPATVHVRGTVWCRVSAIDTLAAERKAFILINNGFEAYHFHHLVGICLMASALPVLMEHFY